MATLGVLAIRLARRAVESCCKGVVEAGRSWCSAGKGIVEEPVKDRALFRRDWNAYQVGRALEPVRSAESVTPGTAGDAKAGGPWHYSTCDPLSSRGPSQVKRTGSSRVR